MKKGLLIRLIFLSVLLTTFSSAWTPVKRLTWNTGISEWPVITIRGSSDKIHIFWADDFSGNFEIFYKFSPDRGNSWSALQRLTWTPGDSRYPDAKPDSTGYIYLTWIDESSGHKEIYFKKSSNGGTNWLGAKRITWTSGSTDPFILIDNNDHVYLFWQSLANPGNEEIFYKKSTDFGSSWGLTQRITWTSDASRSLCADVDSNNTIHIVWQDWSSSEFDIFYKNGVMGGSSWSAPKRLTWTSETCMDPSIAIDSYNNIYTVFTKSAPAEELYLKKSTDGGMSWGIPTRLTWNPGRSIRQHITINQNDVLQVVWDDDSPGNREIFYKWSTDGGLNWSVPLRLSWNSGNSISSKITTDKNSNLHLVWADDTPGNSEIFYKSDIGTYPLKK